MSVSRIAIATATVSLASLAQGEIMVFNADFDAANPTPDFVSGPLLSQFGADPPGDGRGGSNGLRVAAGFPAEIFWNTKIGGNPITADDGAGVVRYTYHFKFASGAPAGDTGLYSILTYNDASRVNYATYTASALRPRPAGFQDFTEPTVTVDNRLELNGVDQNTADGLGFDTFYRVDLYANLFEDEGLGITPQAYSRALTDDYQLVLGANFAGPARNNPAAYAQRQIQAIQIFLNSAAKTVTFDDLELAVLEATDVDALVNRVRAGGQSDMLDDFNADGTITDADVDTYLTSIFGTSRGDINLDRIVDSLDVAIVQNNLGTLGSGLFSIGDATGDGNVDADDLAFVQALAIPEPATTAALALGASLIFGRHQHPRNARASRRRRANP